MVIDGARTAASCLSGWLLGEQEDGGGSKIGATEISSRAAQNVHAILPEVVKWMFYCNSVCSTMILRHSKRDRAKRRQFQFP